MQSLSLVEAASTLAEPQSIRILRPHWSSVASSEGVGLELRVEKTLEQLLEEYRHQLITLTYYANVLFVHYRQSTGNEPGIPLDTARSETDMAWHIDHLHRKGNISIVTGYSNTPTGIVSKPLLHTLALESCVPSAVLRYTQRYQHLLSTAQSKTAYTDIASQYFQFLHQDIQGNQDTAAYQDFWNYIDGINAHPDILWTPSRAENADDGFAVFVSRMTYHCKRYDPQHYHYRDGIKRRIELCVSPDVLRCIDTNLAHRTFDETPAVPDAEWFHRL